MSVVRNLLAESTSITDELKSNSQVNHHSSASLYTVTVAAAAASAI